MEEKYKCSWCGCEEVVYGVQTDRGKVRPAKKITLDEGQALEKYKCSWCGCEEVVYGVQTRSTSNW